MARYKDESPAIRVYTVCDESKYLIVRNVPALGCGEELKQLFATYGEVDECKPMDAEECEAFTDVYWIKFGRISNARFAKRKLDESVFLGNRLQVTYAPEYESVSETQEKLEDRIKEVRRRLEPGKLKGNDTRCEGARGHRLGDGTFPPMTHVSSDQDYFPSQSMNQTVRMVRQKLDKIESNSSNAQSGPSSKNIKVDNRRRI